MLDAQVAYLINDVLSDDAARATVFGVGGPLSLGGRTVAAKTGTTNDYKDGWTMGYTPDLVAGFWAGNNRNESMTAASGLVAAPMWNAYMRSALKSYANKAFSVPDGIRQVEVDALSGKLPTDATPTTKTEKFASWSVPTENDDVHKKVRVMRNVPDKLAPKNAPDELVEEKVFAVLHSERPDNSAWENPVIAWAKANGYNNVPTETYSGPMDESMMPEVSITSPGDNTKVTGDFEVNAFVKDPGLVSKVEFLYDSTVIGQVTQAPFKYTIKPPSLDGKKHTVVVKLTKSDNSQKDDSIQVTAGG